MFEWFKRGAGKDGVAPPPVAAPVAPAAALPATIKFHDAYGRLREIPREEWRNKVLLVNLRQAWNDPDQLYQQLISGANDGFFSDLLQPANRLVEIDPDIERSHVIASVVLLRSGDAAGAARLLERAIAKRGESGALLTNLAKARAGTGQQAEAERLLWRALQADPNQDNGLQWWTALHRERGGAQGEAEASAAVAALPGSWRAQLWLARRQLDDKNLEGALALYQQVLAAAPANSDAGTMISGDLCNRGHLAEAVALVSPWYNPAKGDVRTGTNLLQAYLQLQDAAAGTALLEALYGLVNPTISGRLHEFSAQFDQLRAAQLKPEVLEQAPNVSFALLEQPLWLLGAYDMGWAYPPAGERTPKIALLALTAPQADGDGQQVTAGREDDKGRTSRAIPVFLAEQLYFRTRAAAHVLIPTTDRGGLALFGGEETDDMLRQLLPGYDYVMTGTVRTEAGRQQVRLHLRRLPGLERMTGFERDFDIPGAGAAALGLAAEVTRHIAALPGAAPAAEPAYYRDPPPEFATGYLGALAQAVPLTLIRGSEQKSQLWGERNILNWLQGLSLAMPAHEAMQFIYLTALVKARRYGSTLLPEFRRAALAKVADMERAKMYAARLAPMVHALYGQRNEFEAAATGAYALEPGYAAWCDRLLQELLDGGATAPTAPA